VRADYRRRGSGRAIVEALWRRAQRRDITGVCLFTRQPEFFATFGFTVVDRNRVPEKFYRIASSVRADTRATRSRWRSASFRFWARTCRSATTSGKWW
jgi:N-acetylglutamate synthase-like GNAT family acetyltransferase